MKPLVALIVSQPGMAERLLAEHADDGGRCRVCSAGAQSARFHFPCVIYENAREAVELRRAGRSVPGDRAARL